VKERLVFKAPGRIELTVDGSEDESGCWITITDHNTADFSGFRLDAAQVEALRQWLTPAS
jgi:hypothetical protein